MTHRKRRPVSPDAVLGILLLSGSHDHSDGALVPTDVHVPAKDVGRLKMGPLSWAVLEFAMS